MSENPTNRMLAKNHRILSMIREYHRELSFRDSMPKQTSSAKAMEGLQRSSKGDSPLRETQKRTGRRQAGLTAADKNANQQSAGSTTEPSTEDDTVSAPSTPRMGHDPTNDD